MANLYYVPTADFVQKTLNAELLSGVTAAATLNNVTDIPNLRGVMIVDRVDSNGVETPVKVEVIPYTGTSGSTVVTLTRGQAGTSDQDHAVGAIVEFGPDIVWAQALIDVFKTEHTETGTHGAVTATSVDIGSTIAVTGVLDEDTMSSNSAVKLATQQSIKAYVDTFPTATSTTTFTNKRITSRESTETSSATPTINTDNVDLHTITALATDITSMTTNLSGTPTDGQKLIVRIQDSGSGQTIAWGASFESAGATLPTSITAGKKAYVGLMYNADDSKWDCIAVTEEA